MRRIRITVAYDGTEFHGWQVQPGLSTIQGWLEKAIAEIEGAPVHVHGSGRTDAGVHALGQVAAFTLENPIPVDNLRKAINRLLPKAIRVLDTTEVTSEFHPRFNSKQKTYEYRIWRAEICPPMRRLYVYHYPYPLDVGLMEQLAPLFEGEHDFSAFAAADEKDALGASKVRKIYLSKLWHDKHEVVFHVCGSGFLKHMVRMMVGALVEAGKGNLSREELLARLAPGFEGKAGPAMPASGLTLLSVEY
ncbi:MAG: tRNA pseudouridine(38-40) synthase TruA [Candidatus Solibacter usitatus]|nr:tRNA pseudouridine(38-40) synthase TruA [Candidatus Solibacter usitatus]